MKKPQMLKEHPCAHCWDLWPERPEHVTCQEGMAWPVDSIWAAADGLPVIEIRLDDPSLELGESWPWEDPMSMVTVAEHVQRAWQADPSYPIILAPREMGGYIVDGYHRALRALLEHRETIKAQQLFSMPADGRACPRFKDSP